MPLCHGLSLLSDRNHIMPLRMGRAARERAFRAGVLLGSAGRPFARNVSSSFGHIARRSRDIVLSISTTRRGPTAPFGSERTGPVCAGQPRTNSVPAVMLWVMVWMGYNTEIAVVQDPKFPTGPLALFHGLRAFSPLVAGFLAGIILLKRGSSWRRGALTEPVGLLLLYTGFGVISSIIVSTDTVTALYWAGEYGSVLMVLWATLADPDPLPALSRVLKVNWIMVTTATVSLLSSLGFLSDLVLIPTEGSPLGVRAYGGNFIVQGQVLGMPTTRNTGFGRFAALAALICLARLWQGNKRSKLLWGLLPICLFALVLCQARTATVSLLAGVFMLLWMRRGSKIVLWGVMAGVLTLLGLTGFYAAFWNYLTRGQSFDPTLTGRTEAWKEGLALFQGSPVIGFGFRGDRIFLEGTDVHNLLVQALIYSGVLGTVALMAAFVAAWIYAFRLYRGQERRGLPPLPLEVPSLLAFVTVASITEPTFNLYSVPWLMIAPCFAYLPLMYQRQWVELRLSRRALVTPAPRRPTFAFRGMPSTGGQRLRGSSGS